MISGARNMLQASIDERCNVIERIIEDGPQLIHKQFENNEQAAKVIAKDNCDGDHEVYLSIYSNSLNAIRPEDEAWMIEELFRSMVLLIVSFAETTIRHLLKCPDHKIIGGNYLYKAYNQLNKELSLNLKRIDQYWNGYQDFVKKRNDIAHGRAEVTVDQQYLLTGLYGVHNLLRVISDAIDLKQRL